MDSTSESSLLTTALVGALLPKEVPEGHIVRAWLDSWVGIGHVAETMHEIGYDVRLSVGNINALPPSLPAPHPPSP